jgi:hypothetical protein
MAQQKATIAVIPFTFHKDFRATPGAALETGALTNKFVTALVGTRKFDVVERERLEKLLDEMQLGKTGLMDPTRAVEAGKALGADFMLMGEVSVFTLTTTLKHIELADRWQRIEELRLIVDMRIVETRTTKIVSAFKGDAAMTGKQMFKARPPVDAPLEPATVDEIERQVVDKLVIKVIDAVYPIRVIGVSAEGVVSINRGEGGGVPVGTELDVFSEGEEMVDPDTGEVLGAEETKVGRIRVQEVLPKFSKCSILAGRPQKGNICRMASGAANFAPPPPPPPPRDSTPPVIRILAPTEGATLNSSPITVACEVTDDSGVVSKVSIAGRDAQKDDKGRWRGPVQARDGGNRVRVEAWDGAGNRAEAAVTFNFDSTPPQIEAEATILVEGKVDDLGCTLTVNGQRVEYDKQSGRYSVRVNRDPQNPDTVTIVAEDEFGNKKTETRKIK